MKTPLSAVSVFDAQSMAEPANTPVNSFFRHSYRKAIKWAYSLGAKANGWDYCLFHINDDYVCLETFQPNGKRHRAIVM